MMQKNFTLLAVVISRGGGAKAVCRTQVEIYCPPMVQYSPEWNNALADELDSLPQGYATIPMAITDYAKLRDRIRTCEKEKEKL